MPEVVGSIGGCCPMTARSSAVACEEIQLSHARFSALAHLLEDSWLRLAVLLSAEAGLVKVPCCQGGGRASQSIHTQARALAQGTSDSSIWNPEEVLSSRRWLCSGDAASSAGHSSVDVFVGALELDDKLDLGSLQHCCWYYTIREAQASCCAAFLIVSYVGNFACRLRQAQLSLYHIFAAPYCTMLAIAGRFSRCLTCGLTGGDIAQELLEGAR